MEPVALSRLLARCLSPIFTSPSDVRCAMTSLVSLSAYATDRRALSSLAAPLRRFCRAAPDAVAEVLERVPFDAALLPHGRRAALLLPALPRGKGCDDVLWARAAEIAAAGLAKGAWDCRDCRAAIAAIARWGKYPKSCADAAEAFVEARVRSAAQAELPVLLAIVTALPELAQSPALKAAADRVVALAEVLTPGAIGHICACANKVQFRHSAMAIALQEEAIRFAEESDLFSAVQLLCFVCRQEADAISSDAVKCLAERVVEGKDLDQETVGALCKALRSIPRQLRPELQREMAEVIGFLGTEMKGLLALSVDAGGLRGEVSADHMQSFLSRFLALDGLLPAEEERPAEFVEAVRLCVDYITEKLEDIVSDENPPFSIIPNLLSVHMPETRQCGLAIIREAADQGVHFPTLQTFRFLLALGDHNMKDKRVYRHLRNEFAKTAAGIPMIQLCAALKCFVRGLVQDPEPQSLEQQVDQELEREDMNAFLQFCVENLQRGFADGMEVKCVLSATESLHQLGYANPDLLERIAQYLDGKCASASPSVNSSEGAEAVCVALGEDLLDRFPAVHDFLLEVGRSGVRGEAALPPSEWMNRNDPANFITPLTEVQQEGWNIINRMIETRTADTTTLKRLANEYVAILKETRVDDLKYFFGVFEDKVLKEDKILKQCLDHIVESGMVMKLSATSIGAMLHSLASIRFMYHRSAKRFVLSISGEQWGEMDASPLVQIVAGMAKLSLRIPEVLANVGNRLIKIHPFLSPIDTAVLINALQSVGYGNEDVMSMLMRHAAAGARRWDEVSLTLLFGSSNVHRLLRSAEVATPLLEQAASKTSSPHLHQKITASLRRSALPRELVLSSTTMLTRGSEVEAPLRLT